MTDGEWRMGRTGNKRVHFYVARPAGWLFCYLLLFYEMDLGAPFVYSFRPNSVKVPGTTRRRLD